MIALLGLTSALVYGASDFFGGLAARRMSALLVAFVSTLVAIVIVVVVVLLTAPVWSIPAVVLGAIAGMLGGIGTWAFYASLALGPMSVLSPGVAAVYAVIPVVVGISLGERFPPLGYAALAAVVIAAVMLGAARDDSPTRATPRALLLGLIAGIGFGGYIIAIDRTPVDSGQVPLLLDLTVAGVLFGIVLLIGRLRRGPVELAGLRDRVAVRQSLLAGALLAAGNIPLVIGLHLGDLAVMGVLNSLYPLGTVVLAFIVLRERLSWVQGAGIVLALAASAVLAVL